MGSRSVRETGDNRRRLYDMKRERRIKKSRSRTLADIRRIPKWARKKLGFTCEVVDFSYNLLKAFFGESMQNDIGYIPVIDRTAVTPWIED